MVRACTVTMPFASGMGCLPVMTRRLSAVGPAPIVEGQHHEAGERELGGIRTVEVIAHVAPAVGHEDSRAILAVTEAVRQKEISRHAGSVAPDVDGPALDRLCSGGGQKKRHGKQPRSQLLPPDHSGPTSRYCNLAIEIRARTPGQWAVVRDNWNAAPGNRFRGRNQCSMFPQTFPYDRKVTTISR